MLYFCHISNVAHVADLEVSFKYLGSIIHGNGEIDDDVTHYIGISE